MNLSPLEKKLFDLTLKLETALGLDEEVTATIIVLMDTMEKITKLEEWVDSVTQNGVIQTDETELLNVLSKIDRST